MSINPSGTSPANPPIFNLPRSVIILIVINFGVFITLRLLPAAEAEGLLLSLALIPARDSTFSLASVPPFLTHAFTHYEGTHLLINMAFLAAVGSGVQRRLGTLRFIIFYLLCAFAGAITQLAVTPDLNAPVIGASAAVSGLVGAIVRFAVRHDQRFMFVVLWLGVNLIFGSTAPAIFDLDVSVAWEAHMGGFFVGLILFPIFDPLRQPPPSVKSGP
ncbi:MAG: rhomboid family intramembrane serine protease [Alphaproteobacteria bacterium]